jgi:hypothetical protein
VNNDVPDQSVTFQIADSHTLNGTGFPGIDEGHKFHFTGPRDVEIEVRDACGYCYSFMGKLSSIYANIHLHLNDDGSVSRTGARRPYPAAEGMSTPRRVYRASSRVMRSVRPHGELELEETRPAWGPGVFKGWDFATDYNRPDINFSDD